ncbi:MAG: decarboxylating 6-phosphogluconate dehydrogenase [Candidatus Micrarchaeota archaeon]|nr:decarboxylating 6-phosphogluconate dehydrogenase [Candidatus Micrarchaeota archaeon]
MERTIGFMGLGKMGKNIVLNMIKNKYEVVAFNRSPGPLQEVAKAGAIAATSQEDVVKRLSGKKVVWLMYPSGEVTENAVRTLSKVLKKGDIIINGANDNYKEAAKYEAMLSPNGISILDAGCSGGPSGALNGMSIMVGGDRKAYDYVEQLFKDLSVKDGLLYCGPAGAGHFVKMVHNAVEYGMMQSIAEGFDLMANGPYKNMELDKIAELWNHGSVVRGYLIELTARALKKEKRLESISPYVEDNGEGRWSVNAAVEHAIPFAAISSSLFERFSSRSEEQFGRRLLAALRHEFGGHAVKNE